MTKPPNKMKNRIETLEIGLAMLKFGEAEAKKKKNAVNARFVMISINRNRKNAPIVSTKPHIQYTMQPNTTLSRMIGSSWLADEEST